MDGKTTSGVSSGRNEPASSCANCQRPDDAESMVQCDKCDRWQHYTCAGVNDSVADRSWVCDGCATRQPNDDVASIRSGRSGTSNASALSDCLSQLMERQQAERARAELALQRRHLDEQEQLIDEVLGGEVAGSDVGSHGGGVSSRSTNVNPAPPAQSRIASTPPTPSAPLASSVPRSTPLLAAPKSTGPPTVSESSGSRCSRSLQCQKDPHAELLELRRSKPTPEQLSALRAQLELCRNLVEGIESGAEASGNISRIEASDLVGEQLPKPAMSKSRLEKHTGTILKLGRTLPPVPEDSGSYPVQHPSAGIVEYTIPPNSLWPLRSTVNQTGLPPVSRPSEAGPNRMEPSGKRHALNQIHEPSHYHCPTTNNNETTSEQPRIDARPVENMPPPIPHEQRRESLAHSGDTVLPLRNTSQPEQYPSGNQTREAPSRMVDSSLPPRLSNVQPNQVLPPPQPHGAPTKHQLAARQSLAKELPRFSGDPADWPIFISHYRFTTEACGFTDGENMLRLQRCLTGPALETVRSRLVLPAAVPQVIETLRMRFGRPELLINALLRKVREIPAPRSDRLEGLIDFGMAVQALCDHIEAANERAHLSNPSLLQELVAKLPADQRMMWAGYKRGFQYVDLKTFGDYMASVVQDATSVVTFEPEMTRNRGRSSTHDQQKEKRFVNVHAEESPARSRESSSESREPPKHFSCLNCNQSGHRVRDCEAFKELNVDDRWRRVRTLHLCQCCLFDHGRRACRWKKACEIEGCQFRHHPLLHSSRGPPKPSTSNVEVAENHIHLRSVSSSLFRVIPMTLHGMQGSINTFAFLDEGSDLTLVETELAASLGVKGTPRPLCLRWTGDTSRMEKESQQVTIEISGIGQNRRHKLVNARTVASLGLPRQSFKMEEMVQRHPHLKGIPVTSYENAQPKILIGIDNLRLALPLKVREGYGSAPVAVKTRLGWCVYGPRGHANRESYSFHVCEGTSDEKLHEAAKEFFEVEDTGVDLTEVPLTENDQRALSIMETTTRQMADRFETGLVREDDQVEFPNSYSMALRRVECRERRIVRDPEFKENIHRQFVSCQAGEIQECPTAAQRRWIPSKSNPADEVVTFMKKSPNETGQEDIGKPCSIYRLMPMMDSTGLLRERGRIEAAETVSYEVRHPLILPKKQRVTELICLAAVRAVHLEFTYILSTESCISTVRRCVSRRGPLVEFFSDNGTHIQEAERVLQQQTSQGLFTSTNSRRIFIPPGAPHVGGAWEHLVPSVKAVMTEAYLGAKLDSEGLRTLVVEAERLVNSRPLTYLPLIRRRPKWFDEARALQPSDLVMVSEPAKRNGWERGRIIRMIPHPYGQYRRAVLKIGEKTPIRLVTRLALLDVRERSGDPEGTGLHPGEAVNAGDDELATLPTGVSEGRDRSG